MKAMKIKQALINLAILEDLNQEEDYTSLICYPQNLNAKAFFKAKQNGIIAGIETVELVFKTINKNIKVRKLVKDGEKIKDQQLLLEIYGPGRDLLKAERIALNFIQRLSGIATKTNHLTQMVKSYKVKILDTRKTTPGLRIFEKEAVKSGGGYNHRFGLFDQIMIKDNHIFLSGNITKAIEQTIFFLTNHKKNLDVIVEVADFKQLEEALNFKSHIHRILLDNFTIKQTQEALKIIDKQLPVESSGNITESNIIDYAKTGVDFISCGAITHQINSLNISMDILPHDT